MQCNQRCSFLVQHLEFEKILIPEDTGKKVELAKKLKSHNISLTQYQHVLAQRDIE